MIRAHELVKTFGALRAVDQFSFEVQPGEIYGLLGPNGAGKTTTTRLLSCLLTPTSGQASVAGYSIREQPREVRARIGILTEVPGLYERLTPLEYLDFFAQVHDLRSPRRQARIEEVLRLVDMWDRRRLVMRSFSKGMQQRVAIARTLLHDPEVLFFDEPTAALDPEAARNVRDHLKDLTAGRRRTVLLCTHNLPEAEELCQRLSIVQHGRQIAEGTPAELRAHVERSLHLELRAIPDGLLDRLRRLDGVLSADLLLLEERGGRNEKRGAGGLGGWNSPPEQKNIPLPREGARGWGIETLVYRTVTPETTNPEVVRLAVGMGAEVLGLSQEEISLEEVYLSLIRGGASTTGSGQAAPAEHQAVPA